MSPSATSPSHGQDSLAEAPGLLHDFTLPIRVKLPTLPPPAGFLDPTAPNSGSGELLSVEKRSSSLEPGEIKCVPTLHSPGRFGRDTPEPNPLGSIDLTVLSPGQLTFGFGVICIMAKLSPTFQFKFGGWGGSRIGARLTLYGNTVLVEPKFPTVEKAWITACRRALEHLQKLNPGWEFPPLPMDGPTKAEWDWTRLLDDYCREKGLSHSIYTASSCGNGLFHCDVLVGSKCFRTTRECRGKSEAQNTSAHVALHALMTTEWSTTDKKSVLPANSDLLPEITFNSISERQGNKPIFGELPASSCALLSELPFRHDNRSHGKKPAIQRNQSGVKKSKKNPQRRKRNPQPSPSKGRKPNSPTRPATGALDTAQEENANRIPVTNSRWVEIPRCVVVEDKLKTLKAVRDKLATLGKDASFNSLMKGICEGMKIQPPEIYQEPSNTLPAVKICARFDTCHPYLSRASPIDLAIVRGVISPHSAGSLGIKKMILYLLEILREDAELTVEDPEYAVELRALRDLETEIELDIKKSDLYL